MSMKPGATAHPDASSSRSPPRSGPTSVITPLEMATSALCPGPPVPSNTVPPRMTSSAAIDDELQEVAVGVARVDARAVLPATAVARDRALFDRGPRLVEPLVQRLL